MTKENTQPKIVYSIKREVKQSGLDPCWAMVGEYATQEEAELALAGRKKLRPQARYKIEKETR